MFPPAIGSRDVMESRDRERHLTHITGIDFAAGTSPQLKPGPAAPADAHRRSAVSFRRRPSAHPAISRADEIEARRATHAGSLRQRRPGSGRPLNKPVPVRAGLLRLLSALKPKRTPRLVGSRTVRLRVGPGCCASGQCHTCDRQTRRRYETRAAQGSAQIDSDAQCLSQTRVTTVGNPGALPHHSRMLAPLLRRCSSAGLARNSSVGQSVAHWRVRAASCQCAFIGMIKPDPAYGAFN